MTRLLVFFMNNNMVTDRHLTPYFALKRMKNVWPSNNRIVQESFEKFTGTVSCKKSIVLCKKVSYCIEENVARR